MRSGKKLKTNRGFIKMTLIIVGLLVLLKYAYDLDVISFLTQGRFKELLDKFYNLGQSGWSQYKELIIKIVSLIKQLAVWVIETIKEKIK